MGRHTKLALTLLVGLPFGAAAHAACNPGQLGMSADCPDYTAPATTAVPGPSMDGSMAIQGGVTTTLFNGIVPPNGFMVQFYFSACLVNDNGPAFSSNPGPNQMPGGFTASGGNGVSAPSIFITPPGYKPIGPVTVYCGGPNLVEARAW